MKFKDIELNTLFKDISNLLDDKSKPKVKQLPNNPVDYLEYIEDENGVIKPILPN